METNELPSTLQHILDQDLVGTPASDATDISHSGFTASVNSTLSQELRMDQTVPLDVSSYLSTNAPPVASTCSPISTIPSDIFTSNPPMEMAAIPQNQTSSETKYVPSVMPMDTATTNSNFTNVVAMESAPAELPSLPTVGPSQAVTSKEAEIANSPQAIAESPRTLRPRTVTPPQKDDAADSPARSLTPMSDKIEQTSPVELMETADGSVRIKGELEGASPIPPASYRSRSSSQSSKSSKGSPGSQRSPAPPKSKKKRRPPPPKDEGQLGDGRNDFYCWVCHKEGEVLCCELCPRVMHAKCLQMVSEPEGDWFCPECEKIMVAECKETQSRAMSQLSIDQLALHLRYALQRMKTTGSEPFLEPVNTKEFNDYLDYVFHPMDLITLEKNVKKRTYGCTEAFVADVKWILHNCIIYNGQQTKLTHIAKTIVKIAQHEMSEIEVCPECYLNACRKRDNWFCEPCRDIHVLVWAKLQGFPHWPAKALRIEKGMVDARFFGQHDRAWIPLSGCYLMSKEMPLPVKNKKKGRGPGAKGGLDSAMQECQVYIDNVVRKTGEFDYAPPRTPLTHMDLYRKPAGQGSSKDSVKAEDGTAEQEKPFTGIAVKKEMIEEDRPKQSISPANKSTLGDRVLNLKIGNAAPDISLSPNVAQPKKKSKVVTTSGAHPQKARSFAPKKRASLALLEKTIESCKLSLRDAVESESEVSSSETESSSDEENETTLLSKTTNDKGENLTETLPKQQHVVKTQEQQGASKMDGDSDHSDADLIIDIPEEEETKKMESSVSALIEKGVAKVKKRTTAEGDAKTSFKTKSILLNKETDPSKKASSTPIRTPGTVGGSVKRKLGEDSPQAGSATGAKVRKVEGMGNPSKTDKLISSGQKPSGKLVTQHKEKKRDGDYIKVKKLSGDNLLKNKKDGVHMQHSNLNPKKISGSELIVKKKTSLVAGVPKPKPDDGSDKNDLKSAAKMLAKKVMTRKQVPGQEKPKPHSSLEKGKTSSHAEKTFGESAAKKLSSFTIPKHKPSIIRRDEPATVAPSSAFTSAKPTNPAIHSSPSSGSGNQKALAPSIDVPMQKIQKYNDKVMQSMQQVLVEMYEDMLTVFEGSQPPASVHLAADSNATQQVSQLRLELEHLKWMHQQEIAEMQHNHDLTIAEIRQSLENEKLHVLEVAKHKSEAEKSKVIEETKRKQWCANCGREAIFYCCWNTSYCDYPCQQLHWPKHMATCSQARDRGAPTPTSASQGSKAADLKPDDSATKPASETIASKPDPEEDVQMNLDDDDDDDDHSDNDMMVIDESGPKEIQTTIADMMSPLSPDAESAKPKDKNALLAKTLKSESIAQISAFSSTSTTMNTEKSSDHSVTLTTASEVKPLAGAVVSALTSENKSKTLPFKASAPVASSTATSTTTVVPSKLIDDLFSKVLKKSTAPTSSTSTSTPPSASTLKGILNSVSKSTREGSPTASIPSTATFNVSSSVGGPDKPVNISESKPHSSGFAISAIGERLLKAKQSSSRNASSTKATVSVDNVSSQMSEEQSSTSVVKSITQPVLSTGILPVSINECKMKERTDDAEDCTKGSVVQEENEKPVVTLDVFANKSPSLTDTLCDNQTEPTVSSMDTDTPSLSTADCTGSKLLTDAGVKTSASLSSVADYLHVNTPLPDDDDDEMDVNLLEPVGKSLGQSIEFKDDNVTTAAMTLKVTATETKTLTITEEVPPESESKIYKPVVEAASITADKSSSETSKPAVTAPIFADSYLTSLEKLNPKMKAETEGVKIGDSDNIETAVSSASESQNESKTSETIHPKSPLF